MHLGILFSSGGNSQRYGSSLRLNKVDASRHEVEIMGVRRVVDLYLEVS